MAKFKKGDKAKVLFIDFDDVKNGIQVGDIVTVDEDGTTVPYVIRADESRTVLMQKQMEHYTETPETLTINGVEYIRKPEPSHEWKFGDVAVHDVYGVGIVFGVESEYTIVFKEKKTLSMRCVSPSGLTFLRRTDFSV